jgi:hypothetical protein
MKNVSTYHRWVLALGTPFVVIAPFIYLYYGMRAVEPPEADNRRARTREMAWDVITGQDVRDFEALPIAQFFLAAWVIGSIATIVFAAIPTLLAEKRASKGPQLDLKGAAQHMPFWQVGDKVGWKADDTVRTGVITEAHRRPFRFGDELIDAFAGAPGLVIKEDDTGNLIGRKWGTSFRVAGSPGPSGTIDSIRAEMNAAVSVGDEFAWLDAAGEPVDGTVVEIHDKPFEVNHRRVDASAKHPGYTVRRADGSVLGIADDLRERA